MSAAFGSRVERVTPPDSAPKRLVERMRDAMLLPADRPVVHPDDLITEVLPPLSQQPAGRGRRRRPREVVGILSEMDRSCRDQPVSRLAGPRPFRQLDGLIVQLTGPGSVCPSGRRTPHGVVSTSASTESKLSAAGVSTVCFCSQGTTTTGTVACRKQARLVEPSSRSSTSGRRWV